MNALNNTSITKKLILSLGLIIATVLAVNSVIYLKSREVKDTTFWNDHTMKVMSASDEILMGMVNQETGFRGYLLSGEEKFLDPYKAGLVDFEKAWSRAKSLTSDNAQQQARLEQIRKFAETWRNTIAERAIRLMANPQTREEARAVETSGAGKESMDGLRKLIAEVIEAEKGLRSCARGPRAELSISSIRSSSAA